MKWKDHSTEDQSWLLLLSHDFPEIETQYTFDVESG